MGVILIRVSGGGKTCLLWVMPFPGLGSWVDCHLLDKFEYQDVLVLGGSSGAEHFPSVQKPWVSARTLEVFPRLHSES